MIFLAGNDIRKIVCDDVSKCFHYHRCFTNNYFFENILCFENIVKVTRLGHWSVVAYLQVVSRKQKSKPTTAIKMIHLISK